MATGSKERERIRQELKTPDKRIGSISCCLMPIQLHESFEGFLIDLQIRLNKSNRLARFRLPDHRHLFRCLTSGNSY